MKDNWQLDGVKQPRGRQRSSSFESSQSLKIKLLKKHFRNQFRHWTIGLHQVWCSLCMLVWRIKTIISDVIFTPALNIYVHFLKSMPTFYLSSKMFNFYGKSLQMSIQSRFSTLGIKKEWHVHLNPLLTLPWHKCINDLGRPKYWCYYGAG